MNYFKESVEEVKKVTWPTRNRAISITIITIVFTIIATLLLSFFDFSFRKGYDYLVDLSLQNGAPIEAEQTPDINVEDFINAQPVEATEETE